MKTLWQATASNYCAGFVERDGVVVEAAPILKGWVGRPLGLLGLWLAHTGATLVAVSKLEPR